LHKKLKLEKKYVLFATSLLLGEKNGKIIGLALFTAVKGVKGLRI
jgi:hypothetical protein